MSRVLITGISGQDGAYLAKYLLDRGYEVHGAMRRGSTSKTSRLDVLGITDRLKYVQMEITDFANVQHAVDEVRPDLIFNLAAQSFIADSFAFPHYTADVNYMGVINVLEAVRILKLDTRIYQASTSEMFGEVLTKPQDETTPFNPISPYAVSKLAAHCTVGNYRRAYGMFAACGILFNHESELRGLEFVTRKITSWLSKIKVHGYKPLPLGNLDSVRDWGYAPEYVDVMVRMLEHECADDFVLSTNTEYTVRQFLEFAASELGMDLRFAGEGVEEKAFDAKTNRLIAYISPQYFRAADVVYLRGDNSKAREILGWEPTVFTPEIARKMVKFDYQRIAD